MTIEALAEGKSDFFVSRAGADADAAVWICRTLEGAGYSCKVQDRDFEVSGNWPGAIEKAFTECHHMIAVLSPQYALSAICQDEWHAAYALHRQHGNRLLAVKISNGHLPPLSAPLRYVDLVCTDEGEREKRLLDGVTAFRQGLSLPDVLLPDTGPLLLPEGAFDTRAFTGREEELSAIREALWSDAELPCVALHGLGGIGKSALGREFVLRSFSRYSGACFVNAGEHATSELARLGIRLNPNLAKYEDDELIAREAMREARLLARQTDKPFLLLFDNAEKPSDIPDWVRAKDVHLLVTSRYSTWPEWATAIEIKEMSLPAARLLLRTLSKRELADDAAPLLDRLAGHALAIVQAGAYLRENPSEAVQEYAQALEARLRTAPDDWPTSQRVVSATFAPTIARLLATTPRAVALLSRSSFFEASHVPLALLAEKVDDGDIRRSADALCRYSLWRRELDGYWGEEYSLHRVLQTVVRSSLEHPAAHMLAVACADLLLARFPPKDVHDWSRLKALAIHTGNLRRNTPEGAASKQLALAMLRCGIAYGQQRWLRAAEPALQRASELIAEVCGKSAPEYGEALAHLGNVFLGTDRLEEAEKLLRESVSVMERDSTRRAVGTEIGNAMMNLAAILGKTGRQREAARLLSKCDQIYRRQLGPNDPHVARVCSSRALLAWGRGNRTKAKQLLLRCISILEPRHPDHPELARYLETLAALLFEMKERERAVALQSRAADIYQQYESTYFEAIEAFLKLARMFHEVGSIDESRNLARGCLEIETDTFAAYSVQLWRMKSDLGFFALFFAEENLAVEAREFMIRLLALRASREHGEEAARTLVASLRANPSRIDQVLAAHQEQSMKQARKARSWFRSRKPTVPT